MTSTEDPQITTRWIKSQLRYWGIKPDVRMPINDDVLSPGVAFMIIAGHCGFIPTGFRCGKHGWFQNASACPRCAMGDSGYHPVIDDDHDNLINSGINLDDDGSD